MTAELANAFEALEDAGVPWLVLRGRDELHRPVGDVDLLVAAEHRQRVEGALAAVGFSRVLASGHGAHRFHFACTSAGALLKLDVVDRIEFGPYQQWRTDWAAEVLAGRTMRGGVPVPAVGDEAALHLLHLVIDKGEIAPSRIGRAVSAAGRLTPGEGLAATVDRFFDRRIIGHLRDLVLAGEFDQVPALQADLATMWAGRQSRLLHLAHGLGRRREPRLARPVRRGLSVAVMGPDGSGKTTLLRGLQSDLPVPTRYRYQGLWSPGRWDEVVSRIPGARLARMLGRVVGARVAAGYHRARGRVVLMDRTALDALLPGPVDRSLGGRITRAVARRCTPEHDLVIVLDAPGAEMFRRKGEHTPDQLEVWRQGYLAIAADLPRAVVLDATRSPEQVRSAAGRLVWQSLTGKVA